MYSSDFFGRLFWVDDDLEFKSCPLYENGTGDFDNEDYVSDWEDWDGVNVSLLFQIHRTCLHLKQDHHNSVSLKGL
tara:strand:- start:98 stop:325 length:228 start_codon:yes stop_codon:yes gene_type:complete